MNWKFWKKKEISIQYPTTTGTTVGQIFIPAGANISASTLSNGVGVIITSSNSSPHWYAPNYTIQHTNGEVFEGLTKEEFDSAMDIAFEHIKKLRDYNKDFEDLIK